MARPKSEPARDGDKDQARQTVNGQIRYGARPHPNQLPCVKCGHVWKEGERRHEYDHHKGYAAAHHEDVIALCTNCHHGETDSRAEAEASKFAKALHERTPTPGEASDTRRIEYVPLESLAGATRNVKAHDLPGITSAIKRFGFNDAVIIDERTGRLVSGHGRVEALLQMHATNPSEIPEGVQFKSYDQRVGNAPAEWRIPVQRGWASKSDVEAEAFILAANALGARAGFHDAGLEEVLADLSKADALEGTGYSKAEVDELLRVVAEVPMPELPFGDRTTMEQITFTLSAAQVDVVRDAMRLAGEASDGTGNENRNGNAIANVARGFVELKARLKAGDE